MRSFVFPTIIITISVISVAAATQRSGKQARSKVIRLSAEALESSAVKRIRAYYPPLAKAARLSGRVVVEVILDEGGNVIGATDLSGHPLLKDAALSAARGWRFKPTFVSGVPVKVIGAITFEFNLDRPSVDVWIQGEESIRALATEVDSKPISARLAGSGDRSMIPNASPSISIELSSEQTTVKVGSDIWVDALTTNLSANTVGIGFLPGPYETWSFSVTVQVRDSQNAPVGPEVLDQRSCRGIPNCRAVHTVSRYLGPGETAKDHFLIDRKYDLSRPGTYTVQVVRRDQVTALFYLETVKSNILTFTVTQ